MLLEKIRKSIYFFLKISWDMQKIFFWELQLIPDLLHPYLPQTSIYYSPFLFPVLSFY